MIHLIRYSVLLLMLLLTRMANSQSLSIDDCQSLAEKNYPLSKQLDIISKAQSYTLENVARSLYPQISILGQYTYQSDVTGLPFQLPNVAMPTLDKNQYRLYLDVNQTVYDGGVNKAMKTQVMANAALEEDKLKVEIYKLKERVNQLFFGILLADEQLKQIVVLKSDLNSGLARMSASVEAGVALKSNEDAIKVELLKLEQKIIELNSMRKSYLNMLGLLIGQELTDNSVLVQPTELVSNPQINRPELKMFDRQMGTLMAQESMLKAKLNPKVSLFVQTGFGKPALNMLSNEVQGYYIGGLRLSIPLSGLYTYKNERSLIDAYRQTVEIQKNTFMLNVNMAKTQSELETEKFSKLLESDNEIIRLRVSIKEVALTQLENGIITSFDYIREVNAEDNARLNMIYHKMQLIMSEYNQKIITGN